MNALVQILTLTSGLLVNFTFPMVFGLGPYGEFLRLVLLTLVCHRLADIAAEPLIALVSEERFFVTVLPFNLIVGAVLGAGVSLADIGAVDVPLLFAMLGSSAVMLSLHRLRRVRALVVYLLVFNAGFLLLTGWQWRFGADFGMRGVLLYSNLAGVLIGVAFLFGRSAERIPAGWRELPALFTGALGQLPRALSSMLVFSYLTTLFPLLCVPVLAAAELGQLRVLIAIAQASLSAFPVNIRTIFVALHAGGAGRFPALARGAFWYFLIAALVLAAAAVLRPDLGVYANVAAVTITFFWMVSLERLFLSTGLRSRLIALNVAGILVLGAGTLAVGSFTGAMLLYCLGIGVHTTALVLASPLRCAEPALVYLPMAVSAIVAGSVAGYLAVLPALLALAAGGLWVFRFPRKDWSVLAGRL